MNSFAMVLLNLILYLPLNQLLFDALYVRGVPWVHDICWIAIRLQDIQSLLLDLINPFDQFTKILTAINVSSFQFICLSINSLRKSMYL